MIVDWIASKYWEVIAVGVLVVVAFGLEILATRFGQTVHQLQQQAARRKRRRSLSMAYARPRSIQPSYKSVAAPLSRLWRFSWFLLIGVLLVSPHHVVG